MASQADRLRMSPCYLESEMTCITCHNPHQSVQTLGNGYFNQKCQSCHGDSPTVCGAPAAELSAANFDCVHCHMPPSSSVDIPHVNITDHYISRSNTRQLKASSTSEGHFVGLDILTKPAATHLDMARAYLALYDKYAAEAYVLDSADYRLQLVGTRTPLFDQTQVHLWFNRKNYQAIATWAKSTTATTYPDAWTAYRVGQSLTNTGAHALAENWFERATTLLPYHLDFLEALATIYIKQNKNDQAKQLLLKVITEHPKRPLALLNLGYIAAKEGKLDRALAYYDQALAINPDYVQALINKSAIFRLRKDLTTYKRLLQRAAALEPENPTVVQLLQNI